MVTVAFLAWSPPPLQGKLGGQLCRSLARARCGPFLCTAELLRALGCCVLALCSLAVPAFFDGCRRFWAPRTPARSPPSANSIFLFALDIACPVGGWRVPSSTRWLPVLSAVSWLGLSGCGLWISCGVLYGIRGHLLRSGCAFASATCSLLRVLAASCRHSHSVRMQFL